MYLRAAKTEAEDAGIETDGMATSVSKLREELIKLSGVDIMLDENNFKSTYQIIKELSEVWEKLSDVTQANVLEKIGGKRNANINAALIENFDIAEKAMELAQEATGSALAENEKYLDSIEGHINQVKIAFEDLLIFRNEGIAKAEDLNFLGIVLIHHKIRVIIHCPAIL